MREILDANPDSVVISDEAYVDFGGTSSLPLHEYENLVVVQTFRSRAPWQECVSATRWETRK